MPKFCELPDGREIVIEKRDESFLIMDLETGKELSHSDLQSKLNIGSESLPFEISLFEYILQNASE